MQLSVTFISQTFVFNVIFLMPIHHYYHYAWNKVTARPNSLQGTGAFTIM